MYQLWFLIDVKMSRRCPRGQMNLRFLVSGGTNELSQMCLFFLSDWGGDERCPRNPRIFVEYGSMAQMILKILIDPMDQMNPKILLFASGERSRTNPRNPLFVSGLNGSRNLSGPLDWMDLIDLRGMD